MQKKKIKIKSLGEKQLLCKKNIKETKAAGGKKGKRTGRQMS